MNVDPDDDNENNSDDEEKALEEDAKILIEYNVDKANYILPQWEGFP